MINPLAGRRILVSGASSGLGRACAIACAQAGADVVLLGRAKERLEATLGHMQGGNHDLLEVDLASGEDLTGKLTPALAGKPVHGFLACAGICDVTPVRTTTPDVLHKAMTVNVTGNLEVARVITGRRIMAPEGGSVVLFSSVVARFGGSGLTAYACAKSALEGAAKSMAAELAPRRIRVNCLVPGHIQNTGMWDDMKTMTPAHIEHLTSKYPLGLGTPVDVSNAALFLLSDESRWITGTSMLVDGGYSLNS